MKSAKYLPAFIALMVMTLFAENLKAADQKPLLVDVRHRPPEMIVEQGTLSGPLLDIIEEAARLAGYELKFQFRQFQGSLRYLEQGQVDILPRAICTQERTKFMDFLGPIGYEQKEILFLVNAGRKDSIRRFDDLHHLTVGVKRGTVYFERFDKSQDIVKIESHDDENLVRMFAHNRFDTMIVLDRHAVESALKKYHISAYAYAWYRETRRIGLYYGILRGHPAKEALQTALEKMVISGKVKTFYGQYGLEAPFFDIRQGFAPCVQEPAHE